MDPIARELQADHLIATELEEIDGTYTGKVLHFNKGQAKVDKLMELVERGGCDLSRSYAYTDSHTDLPLLEAVGHPYAINPDRQLRKIARERDWPTSTSASRALFAGKVLAGAGTPRSSARPPPAWSCGYVNALRTPVPPAPRRSWRASCHAAPHRTSWEHPNQAATASRQRWTSPPASPRPAPRRGR